LKPLTPTEWAFGFLRQVVFLGHLLADGGQLAGHLVFELFHLGARLGGLARLGGVALFHLGFALRDHFGDGFTFRIDQQILQILI
jgi:hypothetical protein